MFQLVEDYIRGAVAVAPPKDNYPFTMTNAEAAYAGLPYKLASGKLTACGATDIPHVIVVENADAGTGIEVRGYYITPGMVFKVPTTGTPDAGFVRGLSAADTDGAGNIDATVVADGYWSILRLNANKTIAWVTARSSLFH